MREERTADWVGTGGDFIYFATLGKNFQIAMVLDNYGAPGIPLGKKYLRCARVTGNRLRARKRINSWPTMPASRPTDRPTL